MDICYYCKKPTIKSKHLVYPICVMCKGILDNKYKELQITEEDSNKVYVLYFVE